MTSRFARVVQGGESFRVEQGPDYKPGISAETVGAEALWLGIVTIAPGQRTRAHMHALHESAFYMLSGESLDLYSGPDLTQHATARPGDFLFIPPQTLHVAVNRGTSPAVFVGCRNEATALESVVLHPEMDAKVP